MNNDIIQFLNKLGLNPETSSVYLFLLKNKNKTLSEIRREFNCGNNKVNNIVSDLIKLKLVKKDQLETRTVFNSKDPQNIKYLLSPKRKDVEALENTIINLSDSFYEKSTPSLLKSRVIHYENVSGLKQVLWNTIRARDDLRFYVSPSAAPYIDFNFYDRIREQQVAKKIKTYELMNADSYPEWTNIPESLTLYQARYISQDLIDIRQETLIYNDVTAIYRVKEDIVFCVEIYNKDLADMQKQIFDFVWKRAQEMEIYNEKGALRLKSKSNKK